jgi:hypothetical protein
MQVPPRAIRPPAQKDTEPASPLENVQHLLAALSVQSEFDLHTRKCCEPEQLVGMVVVDGQLEAASH